MDWLFLLDQIDKDKSKYYDSFPRLSQFTIPLKNHTPTAVLINSTVEILVLYHHFLKEKETDIYSTEICG